ncbi:MAG TPA: response regulator [Anaeromyxobacter sp.]|nr:response regulator [Anaeromyxobacter sp.]
MTAPLLLVVEDDPDVRDALSVVLADAGYGLCWASDGLEAMRVLRAGARPAAILLDLMMPGMNGFDFRAAQRADPAIAGIPVILVTAMRGAERAAVSLEAAAYVPKPARVDDLLAVVARVAGPVS